MVSVYSNNPLDSAKNKRLYERTKKKIKQTNKNTQRNNILVDDYEIELNSACIILYFLMYSSFATYTQVETNFDISSNIFKKFLSQMRERERGE